MLMKQMFLNNNDACQLYGGIDDEVNGRGIKAAATRVIFCRDFTCDFFF